MASEEAGNDVEEYENQDGKCGLIFLIDARCSMFTKDYEDDDNLQQTRFNIALKSCRSVMMNKIIAKQKDLVGIVMFGTRKLHVETNIKHVSLLLDLNYPGAPAIKQLDTFLQDFDSREIQSTYGASDDFSLADALWYCSSLFSRSGQNLDEKKILLFTDDSDPHGSNADKAHMARKRAKDLNKVQVSLELIPMGSGPFDYSVFYKELVDTVRGHPDPDSSDPVRSCRLDELLERVNRIEYRRRRYAKIKWDLGNNVFVGVSLYTMYREASVLSTETLSRATNEPVNRVKQIYDKATGELLLPSDVVEYLSIAGSDITFTPEEKEALNRVVEPGITLLGFKPSSVVSEGQHCGQPSFIFPEDTLIKGSRELLKALVMRCIAKKKVAVCCMTPRHRAVTKFFYLVPSEETCDSSGNQITPCGFHALPIPFTNDTRARYMEGSPEIFPIAMEAVRKIVHKLKMSYKPSDFKNPKLQRFWEHLEALALGYPAPQAVEDSTIPDDEVQAIRLDRVNDDFNDNFELEGHPYTEVKRKTGNSASSSASKRAKRDDIDVIEEIGKAIKLGKVETFTVAQLKEFLTFHNAEHRNMRKPQLVKAVYNVIMN